MLKIYYWKNDIAIDNTSLYFKNSYKEKWINDNFTKEMIKDIDKSDVINDNLIKSKILGDISPLQLSTGVKTLILIIN